MYGHNLFVKSANRPSSMKVCKKKLHNISQANFNVENVKQQHQYATDSNKNKLIQSCLFFVM